MQRKRLHIAHWAAVDEMAMKLMTKHLRRFNYTLINHNLTQTKDVDLSLGNQTVINQIIKEKSNRRSLMTYHLLASCDFNNLISSAWPTDWVCICTYVCVCAFVWHHFQAHFLPQCERILLWRCHKSTWELSLRSVKISWVDQFSSVQLSSALWSSLLVSQDRQLSISCRVGSSASLMEAHHLAGSWLYRL